ncbi:diguanylate cyclase [Mariniblastus fucicola]|uniref:diguanylate cyclase n=1 Tax=Mariniblastus fucicola TaxID=980251 RepID=A0A5B9PDU3_9BACT|nr:GGDEF domain-containing protein [Mariniblastus fucicola]QEG23300.1 Diguanylate cyclase DosC [Mariniblastus fucicola]
MAHSINLQTPQVATLNVCDFASFQSLQSAINSATDPVLLVASASELPEVLALLRDRDDVCLQDDPESLKSFRQDRLARMKHLTRPGKDCVDPLTQVHNRQTFVHFLRDMAGMASIEHPVSLLMCDVDHFKKTNDENGHAAGDEVLCELANCLQQATGDRGSVGRMGGDEFGIVSDCSNDEAKTLAENLRLAADKIRVASGATTTLSIGIASAQQPQRGSELLERATKALYAAKSKGRNRWFCIGDLETQSKVEGNDIEVAGLENMARVLVERVANVITSRSRKLLHDAREEALIDGLTGCFNRRYLDRRLKAEFDERGDSPLSVAFLDLDYFGHVNKEHGWSTGDKLLIEVCELIRQQVRKEDWLGRYGGEEFCIVMPTTNAVECEIVLNRIREKVASSDFRSARSEPVTMTVSIGATSACENDRDYSEMLERASEMALLAKRSGRNQVCVGK